MTWVIAEPCIDTKDRACVEVCPVDCIHEYVEELGGFVVPDKDQTGSGPNQKVVPKGGVTYQLADGFPLEKAKKQLFIDPVECIDCGACEPVCPVEAIFEESAMPDKWKDFIKLNADAFKR